MKKLVVLLIIAAALITACGDSWQGSGVVVDRNYDDPDTYYTPGYWVSGTETCSGGYGSTPRTCTQTPGYMNPGYWNHDPSHWEVKVRDDEKGKTHWKNVSPEVYGRCEIGAKYSSGLCTVDDGRY